MFRKNFNILLFIFWFLIVIFTIFHHELWRDEAQAWCIARDCSFFDMLNMAKTEGHPPLWYILLFPFAKSGFSVISMQILAFIFTAFSVFLLIFRSSFTVFQKLITVFSAGFLYYIPVIARNYSLIPPILLLIALFWNKKNKNPFIYLLLLILLSLTHSYMLGLSFFLGLFFILENIKNNKFFCFILIMNFIFLFLWYKGSMNYNYALQTKEKEFIPFLDLIIFLSKIYLFDIVNTIKPLIKYAVPFSFAGFIPFIALALAGFFYADKKIFVIISFSIAFILSAFSTIYFNGILYQKLYLLILILIFGSLIIGEKQNKLIKYSLNILLLISCFTSFIVIKNEILYNFSGGKQMAEYIKKYFNNEKIIIAEGNPYLYSSISAYLPNKKFYSPIVKDYISYFTFNPLIKSEPYPQNSKIYVLDEKINQEESNYKVIFKTDNKNLSSRTEREVFKLCIK